MKILGFAPFTYSFPITSKVKFEELFKEYKFKKSLVKNHLSKKPLMNTYSSFHELHLFGNVEINFYENHVHEDEKKISNIILEIRSLLDSKEIPKLLITKEFLNFLTINDCVLNLEKYIILKSSPFMGTVVFEEANVLQGYMQDTLDGTGQVAAAFYINNPISEEELTGIFDSYILTNPYNVSVFGNTFTIQFLRLEGLTLEFISRK